MASNRLSGWHLAKLFVLLDRTSVSHGSLNVPIEHHPTIRYMVYNGYYKVMSNIPKSWDIYQPL